MKKLILLLAILGTIQYGANAQTVHHHHKHHHQYSKTPVTRTKHNISVTDNDDRKAYEGKTSKQNDGVKKNEQRNLNYQNNGANLPPSNGSNSK